MSANLSGPLAVDYRRGDRVRVLLDGRWRAGVVVYTEPGDHKAVSVDVGEMRYMVSKRRVRRLAVVR